MAQVEIEVAMGININPYFLNKETLIKTLITTLTKEIQNGNFVLSRAK